MSETNCNLRLVRLLRGKKAAEWGKFYGARPKNETTEELAEFWKEHAKYEGYLQALDDLESNIEESGCESTATK